MKLDPKNDILVDSLCTSWGAQNSPIEINYFENRRQKFFTPILSTISSLKC